MRVIGTNADGTTHGVLTQCPGILSNDFFINRLDMATEWKQSPDGGSFAATDRKSGNLKWIATRSDLIFGLYSILCSLAKVFAAKVFACVDGETKITDKL